MKKIQKVIIMISVLLAPIFVFLFLKEFGTNKFELPVYYPEGNPIAECDRSDGPHKLSKEIIFNNDLKLPALFYLTSNEQSEYYSDLHNVLSKYPAVDIWALSTEKSVVAQERVKSLIVYSKDYSELINCELVLGEDHWLNEPLTNKYVLIDAQRRIRGYYECDNLDDIERLDVELDILLNY
jgi:protein SCO1/2